MRIKRSYQIDIDNWDEIQDEVLKYTSTADLFQAITDQIDDESNTKGQVFLITGGRMFGTYWTDELFEGQILIMSVTYSGELIEIGPDTE
jgi:hypothetical protein